MEELSSSSLAFFHSENIGKLRICTPASSNHVILLSKFNIANYRIAQQSVIKINHGKHNSLFAMHTFREIIQPFCSSTPFWIVVLFFFLLRVSFPLVFIRAGSSVQLESENCIWWKVSPWFLIAGLPWLLVCKVRHYISLNWILEYRNCVGKSKIKQERMMIAAGNRFLQEIVFPRVNSNKSRGI